MKLGCGSGPLCVRGGVCGFRGTSAVLCFDRWLRESYRAPMVQNPRYSPDMTLTRLVLLVMAVMVVIIVARTVFGSRR